jgi:hypothetical protein
VGGKAKELLPSSPAMEPERMLNHVTDFMAQQFHAPFARSSFHFTCLVPLQPREAWVCEVEGNGCPGGSFRGEPVIGNPEIWTKAEGATFQLPADLCDTPLKHGAFYR